MFNTFFSKLLNGLQYIHFYCQNFASESTAKQRKENASCDAPCTRALFTQESRPHAQWRHLAHKYCRHPIATDIYIVFYEVLHIDKYHGET